MDPDERQEITNYARVWARRIKVFYDVCLAEGLPEHVAAEVARGYAREYVRPDYSQFYKEQAKAQGSAIENAMKAIFPQPE